MRRDSPLVTFDEFSLATHGECTKATERERRNMRYCGRRDRTNEVGETKCEAGTAIVRHLDGANRDVHDDLRMPRDEKRDASGEHRVAQRLTARRPPVARSSRTAAPL